LRFDLLEEPLPGQNADAVVVVGVAPHSPLLESVLRLGARLALAPEGLARPEPLIKFTDWVERRRVCHESDPEAYEYLLLDSTRRILEGTRSNFYALRGKTLITAGDGILQGITRQVTLELAEEAGLSIELRPLPFDELRECDEAFITSSTRGVVPVTRVAAATIGDGRVGAVVSALRKRYDEFAEANAQPAVRHR
jgi:hypothetical protein